MKAQMGLRRCQGPAATAAPEPSRVEGKQRRNRFHKVLINWDFLRCHSYVLGLTESALKKRKYQGSKVTMDRLVGTRKRQQQHK